MRKLGKWLLTAGIFAVIPHCTMAEQATQPVSRTVQQERQYNQQMAEHLVAKLRPLNLTSKNVVVEYNNGIATVNGQIKNLDQKQLVSKTIQQVKNVRQVDNQLTVMSSPSPAGFQTAAYQQPATNNPPALIQQTAGEVAVSASDEALARQLATALQSANLRGYNIEIQVENGVANLLGSVADQQQWSAASQAASSVPGIRHVNNRMQITGANAGRIPARTVAFQNGQPPVPADAGPLLPPTGPQTGGPMIPGAHPMIAGGPGYGYPGAGQSAMVYNQPNFPPHSWPTTAPYPNSAQVSYPTQYSASAWPYIGPFYPYPQVPRGWRSAQLEWDDGYWKLKFNSKTDKWWWFLHPKNW